MAARGPRRGRGCGAVLLLFACGFFGCLKSDVCKSEQVAVSQADGGDFRCVVPEDCPRPSNVSICLTNTTPEKSCVRCQDTRCVETVITLCDSPETPSP